MEETQRSATPFESVLAYLDYCKKCSITNVRMSLGLAHFGGLFWPTPWDVDVRVLGPAPERSPEERTRLWTRPASASSTARDSPAALPSPRDGHLLLLEMAVREAQIHLRGPVAAQLTTQRALDHQIAPGELLSAGWDAAGAFLARHHIDVWLDRSLLAVVH